MSKTVKEIVAEYLAVNGYGGLHYDECGCFDDNLMACGECCDQCEAAYKVPAHCDTCEVPCDSRGDTGVEWCLTTERPTKIKCVPCSKCGSNNIKCCGSIWNCEDCGNWW